MTELENKPEFAQQAQKFMQALPYAMALGMEIEELAGGVAVVTMPWAEHLVGDPRTGVIHGGVVSALMDTCCGAAVLSHPLVQSGTATLDLRIDYMRAAKPGQRLRARAECYHLTRSVAFVRAVTTDEDADNPVASATGAFTIEKPANG
ncbi:PaaI family thioesterase [Paracoccus tegillarcae]|uniref:Thioesterase n=1 Tax=Paracoccus tegillarcae TaxID=1529068 RepID=A0A2K9EGH3_9RHOB|nr:PaaI family thioesterase [Paracoccus tegillarcae]AUH34070.1 thioesterase [Paracoccus tegillarcae]